MSLSILAETPVKPYLTAFATVASLISFAQAASSSLFNGKSLEGWEGDMKVWRVTDGLIVGGSMEGNPQNEFLSTKKKYRNFALKLEYKLVGYFEFVRWD